MYFSEYPAPPTPPLPKFGRLWPPVAPDTKNASAVTPDGTVYVALAVMVRIRTAFNTSPPKATVPDASGNVMVLLLVTAAGAVSST
jgi:hypothetical protein